MKIFERIRWAMWPLGLFSDDFLLLPHCTSQYITKQYIHCCETCDFDLTNYWKMATSANLISDTFIDRHNLYQHMKSFLRNWSILKCMIEVEDIDSFWLSESFLKTVLMSSIEVPFQYTLFCFFLCVTILQCNYSCQSCVFHHYDITVHLK
jgi:hypothetical protein